MPGIDPVGFAELKKHWGTVGIVKLVKLKSNRIKYEGLGLIYAGVGKESKMVFK